MIEKTTGVILRRRPLTETSLILEWLTPDLGRLSTVAKGALRPKSPFSGKLDLFFLAEFSFLRSRRSELHALREASLRETHRPLRQNLGYLRQASHCAALIERATETETPLPGIFDLMIGLLQTLPQSPPRPEPMFAFELKLLHELGLQPVPSQSRLSAGAQQSLRLLSEGAWTAVAKLRLTETQIGELDRFLRGYLIVHLGSIPAGREAALLS